MNWMQDIDAALSLVLALWGVVALILGPIAFFRARKYFPERREAISPDQLRAELALFDKSLREAFNLEIGRLRLSLDEHRGDITGWVREVQKRADQARDDATAAKHRADLIDERVNGLDRHLIDKLKHIEESLAQLRQVRRGDP